MTGPHAGLSDTAHVRCRRTAHAPFEPTPHAAWVEDAHVRPRLAAHVPPGTASRSKNVLSARRHRADRTVLGPAGHDIAPRQASRDLPLIEHDQMAKAPADHRR